MRFRFSERKTFAAALERDEDQGWGEPVGMQHHSDYHPFKYRTLEWRVLRRRSSRFAEPGAKIEENNK